MISLRKSIILLRKSMILLRNPCSGEGGRLAHRASSKEIIDFIKKMRPRIGKLKKTFSFFNFSNFFNLKQVRKIKKIKKTEGFLNIVNPGPHFLNKINDFLTRGPVGGGGRLAHRASSKEIIDFIKKMRPRIDKLKKTLSVYFYFCYVFLIL